MSIALPCTVFERCASRYVYHMRALGRRFNHEAWVLDSLCAFLSSRQASDLDQALFEAWCVVRTESPTTLLVNTSMTVAI
jgi:integrase/recombinase XerD